MIAYEIYSERRRWGVPKTEESDDPWRTCFDDLHDWFTGPRMVMAFMAMSACVFSLGTYMATVQQTRSTYICFQSVDSRFRTVLFQVLGLALDATVIIQTWRILAWTNSAKLKLRALGSTLISSSLLAVATWLAATVLDGTWRSAVAFTPLRVFDILLDSAAFASLVISASFWICETSLITPSSVVTLAAGLRISGANVVALGDWMHNSRAASLVPVWLTALGAIFFTYTHDLRSVFLIRRGLLALLLMALLTAATIITFTRRLSIFEKRHPINDLIYDAQIKQSRWLLEAAESQSLPVAAKIYEERHSGRAPPPNFAEWYQLASTSAVVDGFSQVDKDMAPFWAVSPAELRKRADAMAGQIGISTITIKNGEVVKGDAGSDSDNLDLDEVAKMIEKFSQHLPDMILPINLSPTPRVLPSWSTSQRQGDHAGLNSVVDFLHERFERTGDSAVNLLETRDAPDQLNSSLAWMPTRASDIGHMQVDACPPDSRSKTRRHCSIGIFCSDCVKGHSKGQLLTNFDRSLEVCAQPDLGHLHAFFMTPPPVPPIRQLLPVFGASKTDAFKDVPEFFEVSRDTVLCGMKSESSSGCLCSTTLANPSLLEQKL